MLTKKKTLKTYILFLNQNTIIYYMYLKNIDMLSFDLDETYEKYKDT